MRTAPDYFREVVSLAIIALFAFAYVYDPADKMMQGALIAAFATAYGYWLGASKPGKEPQPVEVTNDAASPVPVEAS